MSGIFYLFIFIYKLVSNELEEKNEKCASDLEKRSKKIEFKAVWAHESNPIASEFINFGSYYSYERYIFTDLRYYLLVEIRHLRLLVLVDLQHSRSFLIQLRLQDLTFVYCDSPSLCLASPMFLRGLSPYQHHYHRNQCHLSSVRKIILKKTIR